VGFSGIAAFIMLFFGLIIMVSMFTVIQTSLIESSTLTQAQNEQKILESQTKVTIENISFDNTTIPDTTTIVVINSGQTKLSLEQIELYVDHVKIPRSTDNRTIRFLTNSINPAHWDPDEVLEIEVYIDLLNVTHTASITTEYLGRDVQPFLG